MDIPAHPARVGYPRSTTSARRSGALPAYPRPHCDRDFWPTLCFAANRSERLGERGVSDSATKARVSEKAQARRVGRKKQSKVALLLRGLDALFVVVGMALFSISNLALLSFEFEVSKGLGALS